MAEKLWMGVAKLKNDNNLEQWVSSAIEKTCAMPCGGFESAHLDEIEQSWPPNWSDHEYVPAYIRAINASSSNWTGRVALAVPLEETSRLSLDRPPLPPSRLRIIEPPSLYVIRSIYHDVRSYPGEEYRVSYPSDPWGITSDMSDVIFSSRRAGPADILEGEFSNTLWITRYFGGDEKRRGCASV